VWLSPFSSSCLTFVPRRPPQATVVFETYWRFAAERQAILFRRLKGKPPPWTDDPILRSVRFANAYRAGDRRTSQLLIRRVIYEDATYHRGTVFRTLLFRFFNLAATGRSRRPPSTSRRLHKRSKTIIRLRARTPLRASSHLCRRRGDCGNMGSNSSYCDSCSRRHRTADCGSEVAGGSLDALCRYPSIGPFLAYQLAIDLNYGPTPYFDEMDFVAVGPGAREGIEKCFDSRAGWSDEEIIRWVADCQELEFGSRGLVFSRLWGVDCSWSTARIHSARSRRIRASRIRNSIIRAVVAASNTRSPLASCALSLSRSRRCASCALGTDCIAAVVRRLAVPPFCDRASGRTVVLLPAVRRRPREPASVIAFVARAGKYWHRTPYPVR
jgi:5-hmdU DNA kinase-like protein